MGYNLGVTDSELRALHFAAERYLWAQELIDSADITWTGTQHMLSVREADAWAVVDAVEEESSHGTRDVVRAVLSEALVSKVLAFLDSIV